MAQFFDTSTPENERLMEEFDRAFITYRSAALGLIDNDSGLTSKEVSYMRSLKQAKELYKALPLPSEANSSEEAFEKTVEAFKIEAELREKATKNMGDLRQGKAGDEAGIMTLFNNMSVHAQQTVGQPKFAAINQAMFGAFSRRLQNS